MAEEALLPERPQTRDIRLLRPALAFLRPYVWQIAGASIALILTASITLSVGQGMRVVIDAGFGSDDPGVLSSSLMLFAGLVLALVVSTFVRFYLVSWVGERVSADLRSGVYARLISLHPGFFEENRPTEIQSRITTDTTLLQTVIGSSVSIALRNMLMFLGGLVLLIVTNTKLALIVLGCIPLLVMPILLFGRRVRSLSRSSQDTLADVGSYAGESLRNIKLVQSFNRQRTDRSAFDGRVEDAFLVAVRRIRYRAFLIALVMLIVFGAIGFMLWVGGQDVMAGRTTPGELAAFVFYAFIVAGSVGAISEVIADLQRAAGATDRLMELLVAEDLLPEPDSADNTAASISAAAPIAFDDVSFEYPSRPDVLVLQDISVRVEPGELLAIVGPSGAGKSTLFELLLRFYDPTRGALRLDGRDLRSLPKQLVRRHFSLVPQDASLLSGTIREAVAYSETESSAPDESRVWRALERANARAFVERLPQGLDTQLGESGTGVSGGEQQRLAIARALYSEPTVLLLDEATSALDAESESMIRAAIDALRGDCTVLAIAHRLSTVVRADRIVVLDAGRVVDVGTHEELLQRCDLYARFAAVQFDSSAA
ncbi:MAG: ABC transporter transmembrane domain-containing protein [Pseudomonadota bacterium]